MLHFGYGLRGIRQGKYFVDHRNNLVFVQKINHGFKIGWAAHHRTDNLELPPEYLSALLCRHIPCRTAENYNTPAWIAKVGQLGKAVAQGAVDDHIKATGEVLQLFGPILGMVIYPCRSS